MITLIKGKVEDVIIDLRENSPTYKIIESRIIQDSEFSLLLPPGVAHGYKVLEENSIVQYVSNAKHSKKDDLGIRYDSFGYNWNLNNPIISNRDREMPPLNEK
jgi:dTDP-4-dehydrorhamnose 3,5-epimerase-like enzyme